MICKKCAIAGDMVAEARSMITLQKEMVRTVAIFFHGACKGSTHCDCQHKIDFEGKVIKSGQEAGKSSGEDR